MKSKILISGSSGMVGTILVNHFTSNNSDVWQLVRREPGPNEIFWDPLNNILDKSFLENFDIIIHLGGANIAGHRWTKKYKDTILQSRIGSTRLLATTISRLQKPPGLFLCASASGYYGNRFEEHLTEISTAGNSYLSYVVSEWEEAASLATSKSVRTVYLRFGVILCKTDGALKKMLPAFRYGLGGKIGSGTQYMPWISIREIPEIIDFIRINDTLKGAVNIVAPQPVTNTEFSQTLAGVLNRPLFFQVPAFVLKKILGEMADELLLSSARIIPEKLLKSGYDFHYPDLKTALESLINIK